ncbi:hypothetical protein BHM03_00028913 [Ensete ventricosum]|nr:hypothetical protein BHM03_00028913 [Ensete ventricosum]
MTKSSLFLSIFLICASNWSHVLSCFPSAEEDWKTKRELLVQKRVLPAHPPGAINVQIYRLIKEWTAWDIARRAAFAFFGIFSGTEENPEFIQSKLIRLEAYLFWYGFGRSLIAAYLLVLNGYKNVYHLEGGLYTWFKEGLPVAAAAEEEEEEE